MPIATSIMMITPDYFTVDAAINVHMRDPATGRPHLIDHELAKVQWSALHAVYESLGMVVRICPGVPGLADMCFAANQALPYLTPDGDKRAVLSNMRDDRRHREVEQVARFLNSLDYATDSLPPRTSATFFEGTGDALWLVGRRLLVGGYGFRTSPLVYEHVARLTGASVVLVELCDPRFYHLDTALSILTEDIALACREAFSPAGWEVIRTLFPKVIEVTPMEADAPHFATNAHGACGRHVVIQLPPPRVTEVLADHGFTVIPVDTSQFIKSGGSVFCLKLGLF